MFGAKLAEIIQSHFKQFEENIQCEIATEHSNGNSELNTKDTPLVRTVQKQNLVGGGMINEHGFSMNSIRVELKRNQASINTEVGRLVTTVVDYAFIGDSERARAMLEVLLKLSDVRRIANSTLNTIEAAESKPVYTVSSWFLHNCFHYLVQRDVESLHFVTGIQLGNTYTLDKMVTFEMSLQTPVSAKGDISSTHKALIDIEKYGHKLHACFHSHPGKGKSATSPSSVDFDYQARLEKGGYAAIGGIFSRDGYFRVFSLERPFQMNVFGKGVERIDDRIYHLTEVN